jgi:hypothetical protein
VGGTGVAAGAAGVQAAKRITPNDKIILRAIKRLWFMVSSIINSRLQGATCTIKSKGAFMEEYQLSSFYATKESPQSTIISIYQYRSFLIRVKRHLMRLISPD